MAALVVDLLEVVDVDNQYPDPLPLPLRQRHGPMHRIAHPVPVQETRQPILKRELLHHTSALFKIARRLLEFPASLAQLRLAGC